MGDKVIPAAESAELLRAKALRESLERGSPPTLSHPHAETHSPKNGNESAFDIEKIHLEQIVENAPEAISVIASEARVVRINTEFTRLFGYTPDEALGNKIDTLIVPPDRLRQLPETNRGQFRRR